MNVGTENGSAVREIGVRLASPTDVVRIVQIHKVSFPDYFLTNMGDGVLRRYYETYLKHPDGVNVVATVGGEVCAFISGTHQASDILRSFYKRNLFYVIGATLGRVLLFNPIILKGLSMRLCHVRIAFASFLSRSNRCGKAKAHEQTTNKKIGRLVSIAALPECRGKDVSVRMIQFFEKQLISRCTNEVHLCVNSDNARAIQFYKKVGWVMIKDKGSEQAFVKRLSDRI
jgi:ribosomal protein S18 acetylase RimI-like enzyme